MKAKGRSLKYDKAILENAIEEYIKSDKSAKEVAEEFKITDNVLLYHYNKRKEKQENGTQ